MAGEWIKMRSGLDESIKVVRLSVALSIEKDAVVMSLYRLAGWFAKHGHYGKMKCDTHLVDRFLGVDGFAAALTSVGWLDDWECVLTLHGFCQVSAMRKSLGKKLRAQVLAPGKCAACGSSKSLVIDHIVPVVKGGTCQAENLQALCAPCNRSKGKKTPDQWKGRNG